MEGYLLGSVKRTLVSELQAKGYAPHISDVHNAAVRVIEMIEAHFKVKDPEVQAEPVVPVTPTTPVSGSPVSAPMGLTKPVEPQKTAS